MITDHEFLLGEASPGQKGIIAKVGGGDLAGRARDKNFDKELERRLLEMGFVEGAHVEVLHQGFLGKDPIGVKIDAMRVALRRHEANLVLVRSGEDGG